MSLLEIADFSLAFGQAQVLDRISFGMEQGETLGIVGESGCGKSVLARAVPGLHRGARTGGEIRFRGKNVLAARGLRGAEIGMVFQDPTASLNPVFTIGAQLRNVLRAHRLSRDPVALLAEVSLADVSARFPHELSGGQRQRVMIALALAAGPALLLADEPTTALDVTIQAEILSLLAGLVARRGLALLLISHDIGVVAAVCARVLVMYAGTLVEDAPTATLLAAPRHPYTRGLLASVPDLARPDVFPTGLPGSVPSLSPPPPGCRFAPRCPLVMPVCRQQAPVLRGAAHRTACHAL